MDANLPRWIKASVSKHVDDRRGSYYLWIDGQEMQDLVDKSAWFELRVNGPHERQLNNLQTDHFVEISLLSSAAMTNDAHLLQRMQGVAAVAMKGPIHIFKFGTDVGDDLSYVGCLALRDDVERPLDLIDWGQLSSNARITQGAVEGYYKMALG